MQISPIITKQRAEELLSKASGLWPSRRKIVKVELFYLPVFIFTIDLEDKKGTHYSDMISVDGIRGEFAFFREDGFDIPREEIATKIEFKLTENIAGKIAINEYQRFIYRKNMRNPNFLKIVSISRAKQFYYPYWIGYFRKSYAYDFDVIDAVGGNRQGVRMRPVFMDLLLEASGKRESE